MVKFFSKFMILSKRTRRWHERNAWLLMLYAPIATAALLFVGLVMLQQSRQATAIELDGISTRAKVTSTRLHRSTWTSRYTYVDGSGRPQFGEATSSTRRWPVGSEVAVRYSRSKPWINTHDLARLKSSTALTLPLVSFLLGLVLIGPVGLIVLVWYVRTAELEPDEVSARPA